MKSEVMDEAMSNVLNQLSAAMDHLKQERNMSVRESRRQEQLRTAQADSGLSSQVDALVRSIVEQVEDAAQCRCYRCRLHSCYRQDESKCLDNGICSAAFQDCWQLCDYRL
jgi:hypothetical protein